MFKFIIHKQNAKKNIDLSLLTNPMRLLLCHTVFSLEERIYYNLS